MASAQYTTISGQVNIAHAAPMVRKLNKKKKKSKLRKKKEKKTTLVI